MIYLASPYSSPIIGVQQSRFESARTFTLQALKQGVWLFSPIVYAHDLAIRGGLPKDAIYWHNFNMQFLRHSEAVFVLDLPGWETSKGVALEINMAKALGLPIVHYNEQAQPVKPAAEVPSGPHNPN